MYLSAETHQGIISRIAAECESMVIALDYKLAPESPFPGPVLEGVALFHWLIAKGYAASNIALAGDSAGGGLVLAVIAKLKQTGAPLPACAAVTSSYADLSNSGESIDWVTQDPCVTREGLELCGENYLQGHDPRDPIASPMFADYTNFPPLLIQAGSRERLLSDSTRIAAKADASGVDVTLEVYDQCPHLWHWWAPSSKEAVKAVRNIGKFVRKHTSNKRTGASE